MGYWGRPHLTTNKTLDALTSFTYLPAAHFFSHLAGSLFLSLSLYLHHGTYIFLFFFSSDVKSVYCVLLTTTNYLGSLANFQISKNCTGRSVGNFTISKTSQAGRTTTQLPSQRPHPQFSRFSSILFAWKERD